MDPANGDKEAIREVALDIAEDAGHGHGFGPGLLFLDVVRRVKDAFRMPRRPTPTRSPANTR